MNMEPYNPDARCPKCHSTDIAAQHVRFISARQKFGRYRLSFDDRTEPPAWMKDDIEHILRTCRWCRYEWKEEPLDVVREISVKTEAE